MERTELINIYSKQLCIHGHSTCTQKSYIHCLNLFLDFIGEKNILSIDGNVIYDFIEDCKIKRKFSYSSIKQMNASIHFLFFEVLKKEVDFDFCLKMKKPDTLPEILSRQEIKRILDSTTNLKHLAIISTIYSCGLRLSEITNLKIADVDAANLTVIIVDSNGKKNRKVVLSEKLLELLKIYFKKYKPQTYLFEGNGGERYSARAIQSIFQKGVKLAKINKKVSVLSLRHSFASHLLDTGTDIRYIREILGHKHLSTTQIYTRINPFSIKKIKSPFDSL